MTPDFNQNLNNEPHFPLWGLPSLVVDMISEVAEARQCHIDLAAGPAIAAISAAVGRSVTIGDEYKNRLNVLMGAVAESSSNKSTPAQDMFAPLKALDYQMYDEYEQQKSKYEADSSKKGSKPTKLPPTKQLFIGDITPEARVAVLKDNPRGVLQYRDELAGIFKDIGRYNQSGEVEDLISVIDGSDINRNTKKEGRMQVRAPWLSVYGTIQPKSLRGISNGGAYLDNGLLPRFLWLFPQWRPLVDYDLSRVPDKGLCDTWSYFIMSIYKYEWNGTTLCRFDPEARKIYNPFRNDTKNYFEGYEGTIWGKLHSYVVKLAGIAAVARYAADYFQGTLEVKLTDMLWAVQCAYYFRKTALWVEELSRPAHSANTMSSKEAITILLQCYPKLKKAQLANALGVSPQYITNCTRGREGEEDNKPP